MTAILVPLDGSPLADSALAPAADIARRMNARLRLVGVHTPVRQSLPGIAPGASADQELIDERCRTLLREHLEHHQGRLRGEGHQVEVVLREGRPAEEIADEARDCALVVLTSHGRGGVERLWLGSVTDALVRLLPVPVLLVRASIGDTAAPVRGRFERVLVALDGRPEAEAAVETARAVAGRDGVEYTVLRVATPLHPLMLAAAPRAEAERDTAEQTALARTYVEAVAARLAGGDRPLAVKPLVVADTDPARAILRAVDERGVDLLVLATHAGGAMHRLLIGSVADKVLRAAPVPVLLQRVEQAS